MEINNDIVNQRMQSPIIEASASEAAKTGSSTAQTQAQAPQSRENAIVELLLDSGFRASPENIKLAMTLLDGQLTLNRENLQKLNQSLRLLDVDLETGNADEALFFLKNGIAPTPRNAELLKSYINGGEKIMLQLESLMQALEELPDGVQEKVLLALAGEAGDIETPQAAIRPAPQGNPMPQNEGAAQGNLVQTDSSVLSQPIESAKVGINISPQTQARIENNTSGQTNTSGQINTVSITQDNTVPQGVRQEVFVPDNELKQPANMLQTEGAAPNAKIAVYPGETEPSLVQREAASQSESLKPPEVGAERVSLNEEHGARGIAGSDRTKAEIQENILRKVFIHEELDRVSRSKPETREQLISYVKQRLRFDPQDTSNKDVDEFLNRLRDGVEAARAELSKSGAGSERLQRELASVKESLDFVNHIKDNVYLQLPISVHNHETNGEILVFKDKSARKRSSKGTVSALIALDTLSLGRYEVYVQKENRSVHCQFRLRDERVERMTQANIPKLESLLKEHGYDLASVTYKKTEESFTLLSKPPVAGESMANTSHGKLAFDVRL